MFEKPFGSGYFGEWIEDGFGLHKFFARKRKDLRKGIK